MNKYINKTPTMGFGRRCEGEGIYGLLLWGLSRLLCFLVKAQEWHTEVVFFFSTCHLHGRFSRKEKKMCCSIACLPKPWQQNSSHGSNTAMFFFKFTAWIIYGKPGAYLCQWIRASDIIARIQVYIQGLISYEKKKEKKTENHNTPV